MADVVQLFLELYEFPIKQYCSFFLFSLLLEEKQSSVIQRNIAKTFNYSVNGWRSSVVSRMLQVSNKAVA